MAGGGEGLLCCQAAFAVWSVSEVLRLPGLLGGGDVALGGCCGTDCCAVGTGCCVVGTGCGCVVGVGSPGSGFAVSETVLVEAGGELLGGGLLKLAGGGALGSGALGAELGGALDGTWGGLLIGAAVVGGCVLGGAVATGGGDEVGAAVGGAEMFPVPLSRFTLVGRGEMAGRKGCDSLRGGGAWAATAEESRVATAAAPIADRECLIKRCIGWVFMDGLPSGMTVGLG